MRISTIVKAVSVVAAMGVVGVTVYSKVKENKETTTEPEVKTEEVKESEKPEPAKIDTKRVVLACSAGCVCGGLILVTMPAILGRKMICHYAIEAVKNGNLTMEELIELAKGENQEVA